FKYKPDSEGDSIESMLLLADDSILAGGFGGYSSALLKLSPQGVLNTHFGDPSSLLRLRGANLGTIRDVTMDSQGRFILSNGGNIARLNKDFTLDKTFASAGVRSAQPTEFGAFSFNDFAMLSNGRFVLA